MTFWGVGPKYTLYSAMYCIFIVTLSRYLDPYFKITLIPYGMLATIGIILIIVGLPFYIISLITIKRAYKAERLVTDGTFGMCRHPVYSAWIIFFVPGIMLLINTWIGLTAPILMYFLIQMFANEEEIYLENTFGKDYLVYKERIPKVLPIGWFIKSKV